MAGNQMLQQLDIHCHIRNVYNSHSIHQHQQSNYAPRGLAEKNFDSQQDTYISIQGPKNCWSIMNTKKLIQDFHSEEPDPREFGIIPAFHHVRTVCIDSDKFMTCTCSYCYQYLTPCRHMLVVPPTPVPPVYLLNATQVAFSSALP